MKLKIMNKCKPKIHFNLGVLRFDICSHHITDSRFCSMIDDARYGWWLMQNECAELSDYFSITMVWLWKSGWFSWKMEGLNRNGMERRGGWKWDTCPSKPQDAIWNKISHLSSKRTSGSRKNDKCPQEGHMSWKGMTCVTKDTCPFWALTTQNWIFSNIWKIGNVHTHVRGGS